MSPACLIALALLGSTCFPDVEGRSFAGANAQVDVFRGGASRQILNTQPAPNPPLAPINPAATPPPASHRNHNLIIIAIIVSTWAGLLAVAIGAGLILQRYHPGLDLGAPAFGPVLPPNLEPVPSTATSALSTLPAQPDHPSQPVPLPAASSSARDGDNGAMLQEGLPDVRSPPQSAAVGTSVGLAAQLIALDEMVEGRTSLSARLHLLVGWPSLGQALVAIVFSPRSQALRILAILIYDWTWCGVFNSYSSVDAALVVGIILSSLVLARFCLSHLTFRSSLNAVEALLVARNNSNAASGNSGSGSGGSRRNKRKALVMTALVVNPDGEYVCGYPESAKPKTRSSKPSIATSAVQIVAAGASSATSAASSSLLSASLRRVGSATASHRVAPVTTGALSAPVPEAPPVVARWATVAEAAVVEEDGAVAAWDDDTLSGQEGPAAAPLPAGPPPSVGPTAPLHAALPEAEPGAAPAVRRSPRQPADVERPSAPPDPPLPPPPPPPPPPLPPFPATSDASAHQPPPSPAASAASPPRPASASASASLGSASAPDPQSAVAAAGGAAPEPDGIPPQDDEHAAAGSTSADVSTTAASGAGGGGAAPNGGAAAASDSGAAPPPRSRMAQFRKHCCCLLAIPLWPVLGALMLVWGAVLGLVVIIRWAFFWPSRLDSEWGIPPAFMAALTYLFAMTKCASTAFILLAAYSDGLSNATAQQFALIQALLLTSVCVNLASLLPVALTAAYTGIVRPWGHIEVLQLRLLPVLQVAIVNAQRPAHIPLLQAEPFDPPPMLLASASLRPDSMEDGLGDGVLAAPPRAATADSDAPRLFIGSVSGVTLASRHAAVADLPQDESGSEPASVTTFCPVEVVVVHTRPTLPSVA